jgi:hypothetical protein
VDEGVGVSVDELTRFDWVQGSAIGEAGCITFVERADLAAVASAFGGDLAHAGEGELADSFGDPAEPSALLRQVGDVVIVVENNGFEGSRPEVLQRLPGSAVSLYWNVNAVTRFSYAVEGTVLTAFEAMLRNDRSGAEPDAVEA